MYPSNWSIVCWKCPFTEASLIEKWGDWILFHSYNGEKSYRKYTEELFTPKRFIPRWRKYQEKYCVLALFQPCWCLWHRHGELSCLLSLSDARVRTASRRAAHHTYRLVPPGKQPNLFSWADSKISLGGANICLGVTTIGEYPSTAHKTYIGITFRGWGVAKWAPYLEITFRIWGWWGDLSPLCLSPPLTSATDSTTAIVVIFIAETCWPGTNLTSTVVSV